jgi:predicted transcriptional regulator
MRLPRATRRKIAEMAGTTEAYLSKIVRGHSTPSLSLAVRIVVSWKRCGCGDISVEQIAAARRRRISAKVER